MFLKAGFGIGETVEIYRFAAAARQRVHAAARTATRAMGAGHAIAGAIVDKGFGAIIDVERGIAGAQSLADQIVARPGFGGKRRAFHIPVYAIGRGQVVGRAAAVEQRIFLQLNRDERINLQIGKRQQLDRLLELRRHHQRLALPDVEAWTERHQTITAS